MIDHQEYLLGIIQAIFEPSRSSSLDFGRDFVPVSHLPERHFFPVIKILRPYTHILEKKCVRTSWMIKSILLGSF